MGLVDYFSRQPNQEAKVTNKYDEEFAIATITRIRESITAIYVNTTQQNCQSQHFCTVNHTHSTRASHPHPPNYSNCFLSLIVIPLGCFSRTLQTQLKSILIQIQTHTQVKSSRNLKLKQTQHTFIQSFS